MRHNGKRWIGILLSLVMVLGLMPGTGLTAYAAEGTGTATDPILLCSAPLSRHKK